MTSDQLYWSDRSVAAQLPEGDERGSERWVNADKSCDPLLPINPSSAALGARRHAWPVLLFCCRRRGSHSFVNLWDNELSFRTFHSHWTWTSFGQKEIQRQNWRQTVEKLNLSVKYSDTFSDSEIKGLISVQVFPGVSRAQVKQIDLYLETSSLLRFWKLSLLTTEMSQSSSFFCEKGFWSQWNLMGRSD